MRLRKGRVFVHLGTVVNPDVCVVIADFFMRIHTVSWSVVVRVARQYAGTDAIAARAPGHSTAVHPRQSA